jgi:S-adenosyl-L-methionine hydrolase (adenosine-forming)
MWPGPYGDPHPTFHGRDVFAPVAAHLSLGKSIESVGARIVDPVVLSIPGVRHTAHGIEGEVIYVDRFGNVTTNIEASHLTASVEVITGGGVKITGLSRFFGEAPEGDPLALINSFGYLEVAVNRGDAAALLGVGNGAPVEVKWRKVTSVQISDRSCQIVVYAARHGTWLSAFRFADKRTGIEHRPARPAPIG